MSISDTNFFNSYQNTLGFAYAQGFEEIYNPQSTIPIFSTSRQLLLASMSSSDVSNGLSIVNAHLASESTFTQASAYIVRPIITTFNSAFYLNYGVYAKDFFNGIGNTKIIAWKNSFKEAWYQANSSELVQQIGYATWNGTNLVYYPAYSPITNTQNSVSISTVIGNAVTVYGFSTTLSDFAMFNDIIVASASTSLPTVSNISLSTTVTGYGNTNVLILSGSISTSATNLFAFRPIKSPEYLEFRFGTSKATGLAATAILSDITLSVTLTGGSATTTIPVSISTSNSTGRAYIGAYGMTTYKATGISSILISSGSVVGLGSIPALEIWTV